MIVYVLTQGVEREGEELLGIFSSEESARRHVMKLLQKSGESIVYEKRDDTELFLYRNQPERLEVWYAIHSREVTD